MLPASVVAYDRATNRASVQPLIPVITTSGVQINRAPVASVPVLQLGGGGFVLSFPIAAGDLGWIKANDRDISLFKQSLKNSIPNTQRKHSFEDAMFIPDTMFSGVTIAGGDADNVVLQNLAGTVKISLSGDTVTLKAPHIVLDSTDVEIEGIKFSTHEHTGVTAGGAKTGGPVNP
jgi:hypothetical protein